MRLSPRSVYVVLFDESGVPIHDPQYLTALQDVTAALDGYPTPTEMRLTA